MAFAAFAFRAAFALACVAVERPLLAQGVATSFDQLQVLVAAGDTVTLTDSTGADIRGVVSALSASTLSLGVDGAQRDFLERDVALIHQRRGDSLGNGALRGLAIGAAFPLVAFAACGGDCEGAGALVVAAAAAYGGIGAGIGVGIDALVKGDVLVYQRPTPAARGLRLTPMLTRRGAGVSIAVGF
jgi:hypothetical protein